MDLVPPLPPPPPRFPCPNYMSPDNLPTRTSLFPHSCLLSVRFSFIFCLPSGAGCHPPSSHTTDWRPVPCCPWCPGQCPDVWGFAPPTCAAGGTCFGCGWRGLGDDAPPMVLRSSMRLAITTRPMGEVYSLLLTPLDHLGARLCLPPPLPPSPYNLTCPDTLPTSGRVF